MADTSLRSRLLRMFSANVIVRNVGGRKLKIVDTDELQYMGKNKLVDRFQRLHSGTRSGYGGVGMLTKALRLGLFKDYEAMDNDPIIASALDIYADESTMKNEYGSVLEVHSDNQNIKTILHNLFYDILNIEFNLWPWIRNMCKYGDFYLQLNIDDKYGIMNVTPLSAYDVNRLEGPEAAPEGTTPEEIERSNFVKFTIEAGDARHTLHTAQAGEKHELENYEVAHFRLLSDSNFLPYGKSMVEGTRKVWKQLMLMEDAMLIHRIMRAPEKRIFRLDIGNIPPAEVDNYMEKVISKMKKAPYVDENTGDYNLKYNMQNITEDFFLPVRGGDSGTSIDSLPGLTYEAIDDIEYLRNKLLASLRVPKAFLGFEEEVGSKATLAAEDVRFARTIERIQRITISELTKIAIIHLYAQGFTDAELVNFELSITNPSTIYEQEKISLWNEKTSLASAMLADGIMSSEWIYKNIFNFTEDEIKELDEQIVFDKKNKFRREQIEAEGNDPKESGQAAGTPSDMAMGRTGHEINDEGGSPEGGWEGAGRPDEPSHYKKDSHVRGRDPLGSHDKKKAFSSNPKYGHTFKGGTSLALAHLDKLKRNKIDKKILNESSVLEDEYSSEVSASIKVSK